MNKDQLLADAIREIADLFGKSPEELSADTRFLEDLDAGSIQRAMIAGIMSDLIDDDISYTQIGRYATIGEMVNALTEY